MQHTVSFSEFVELVVRQNVRPERPDAEGSQLSDAVWRLAEKCWMKDPKHRPNVSAICDTLSDLLNAIANTPPTSSRANALAQPRTLSPDPVPATPSDHSPNLILRGHTDVVYCAMFSSDGKLIISGSRDCTVMVWNAQTGKPVLRPLKMHTAGVLCVGLSFDGRRIASGSDDSTIRVWDASTGQMVAGPFIGHDAAVWSVSFSPDGKRIASGSLDRTIRIWDAQTGDLLAGPLTGHHDPVTSVAFSGHGKRIASGSFDTTVRVWNVKSGRLLRGPLKGHNFVAFSPDGKSVVSSSRGGSVRVWDVETGLPVSGPLRQHAEGALKVMFTPSSTHCAVSPDGKWMVGSKFSDRTVDVWDSKTGLLLKTFEGTPKTVTFSPDSKRIVSSVDKTIRIHVLA